MRAYRQIGIIQNCLDIATLADVKCDQQERAELAEWLTRELVEYPRATKYARKRERRARILVVSAMGALLMYARNVISFDNALVVLRFSLTTALEELLGA
jgi:hypothetical protein